MRIFKSKVNLFLKLKALVMLFYISRQLCEIIQFWGEKEGNIKSLNSFSFVFFALSSGYDIFISETITFSKVAKRIF